MKLNSYVNAMLYYAQMEDTGVKPDYLVGHSLGEYTALLAAEVFDFQTGLKLVKKRGELMSSQPGYGMAAVMGLLPEEVEKIIIDNHLADLYVANYNTNNQTVISGCNDKLIIAEKVFYDNFAFNYVRLKVSNAFHSPYMDSASQNFSKFLQGYKFNPPKIPVIANIDARPSEQEKISKNLSEHINSPVRWLESISYLKKIGVFKFEELGNTKILTDMIKYID